MTEQDMHQMIAPVMKNISFIDEDALRTRSCFDFTSEENDHPVDIINSCGGVSN